MTRIFLLASLCMLAGPSAFIVAGELKFRTDELKTRLSVGYAVRLLDMNEDGKQDIVIVDSKRFLWLEKRVVRRTRDARRYAGQVR